MTAYERLHVQLIEKASDALRDITATEGLSKTDAVIRALTFYAWVLNQQADGAELLIRDTGGTTERVRLL